ncbi:hypothetical protein [Natronosalvus caseinilyticus]|uniref:hypothetical protein n=1 Tax=Natronosalvus caseinilyticus TaxID=2953747 RepID=UPI0028AA5748|nr:hypothetical protein [Natronosalvus caseinilyticus]
MRVSIPGMPGIYYDTDAESTAVTLALTAAGRRAPKPHGYAVQALPYLWGFDVDLNDVPPDHPLQYLHPDGARSIQEFAPDENLERLAGDADRLGRVLWAINEETERGIEQLIGKRREEETRGTKIEIESGEPEGRDRDRGRNGVQSQEQNRDRDPGAKRPHADEFGEDVVEPGPGPDTDADADADVDPDSSHDPDSDPRA